MSLVVEGRLTKFATNRLSESDQIFLGSKFSMFRVIDYGFALSNLDTWYVLDITSPADMARARMAYYRVTLPFHLSIQYELKKNSIQNVFNLQGTGDTLRGVLSVVADIDASDAHSIAPRPDCTNSVNTNPVKSIALQQEFKSTVQNKSVKLDQALMERVSKVVLLDILDEGNPTTVIHKIFQKSYDIDATRRLNASQQ